MKSSHSIKSTIFKAVQKLDPEALSFHLVDTLNEDQIENLLTLADHAVMAEMREATAGIDDVPQHEFVDYAAEHSRTLLKYLSVRAILCGEAREENDFSDIKIF
jgi:hypothetical protein